MTRKMFIGQYIELILFAVPDCITGHTVSRQELVFGGCFGFDRDFEILQPWGFLYVCYVKKTDMQQTHGPSLDSLNSNQREL